MSKRVNGEGSIRKRTDGRWEAKLRTADGKRISLYAKTQREVKEKLKAKIAQIDSGRADPSDMTVSEWITIWLQTYCTDLKPTTLRLYESYLRVHIDPVIGSIPAAKLKPYDVQSFYNSRDLSPKSIKNLHGMLHKALKQAVADDIVSSNVIDQVKPPKAVKPELTVLDDDLINTFLSAIRGHRLEVFYITALFTGLRQGEMLGLRWRSVDLENRTVKVERQIQKIKGEYIEITPKHDKQRTIMIPEFLADLLRSHRLQQNRKRLKAGDLWTGEDFVFCNGIGEHLCRHTVYKAYKRIVKQMDCPNLRFHDLRHSYAVAALRSGIDVKTVQSSLGHHSASFTMDTYIHTTDQMKKEAADKMQAFYENLI